ncbi:MULTISPECIES: septum site-determining protein MinC [Lactobacillaceae]|uniref:septum site-determining protein MinC n=1 Tax=Lactobacillaceae TaxID=33958 RepID=UPI000C1B721C|nr:MULTISPECIES: septum site-determining protein MinC [Lactobacillaceae]
MNNVVFKGNKEGIVVTFNDEANLEDSIKDFKELILQQNLGAEDKSIKFFVKTGSRQLSSERLLEIKTILSKYPQIDLQSLESDVLSKDDVEEKIEESNINIETGIIRSGQKREYQGDLIFLGTLHPSAQISATGSVYILGEVSGIVQAGYPDNTSANILGNLAKVAQVRIADTFEIVADGNSEKYTDNQYAYLDDIHSISVDDIKNFKN